MALSLPGKLPPIQSSTMNSIEPLELRISPAVVAAIHAGVLHIDHIPATTADVLKVLQMAPGKFEVTDMVSATNYGTFENVKSIDIALGDTDDTVNLQCSSDGLAGTLKIATGPGANTVNLQGVAGSGRIGGAVTITGNAGADALHIGGIAMKSNLTFIGNGGTDSVSGDEFIVGKTLFIDNVENTTFDPIRPIVLGALNVDQDEAASAVVFILNNVVTVKGKLTYCGSPTQDDNVTLVGQVLGPALLMLDDGINNVKLAGRMNSTLTITGGTGADTISFTDAATAFADPLILPNQIAVHAKAVKLSLGAGANTVNLEKATHFYSSLAVATGAGNDTVNFGDFFVQKDLKLSLGDGTNMVVHAFGNPGIGGAFNYIGGVDADTVSIDQIVADKISIKLGDGANSVTGLARIVGKVASIIGGAGVDTLNLGLFSFDAVFTAKLGAGLDKLTYSGGAFAAVRLDGGTGDDTLVGTALLPADRKIVSFEL